MPGAARPTMSYGRLAESLNNVAQQAHAAGLKRGDTVAIDIADPVQHLLLTLGLMRIGIVTLSGGAVPPEIPVTSKLVDAQWLAGDGKVPPDRHDGDGLARIVLTSGTTGQPKGVALTHEMTARRVGTFTFAFGNRIPQCARMFVDVALASSYGFQWIVWLLSRGGAVFLRGTDAAETMQAFELYKVQGMVAAPSGLAEFVELYEQSPAFTCPFDVIVAGGSLLWKSLADRVRMRMCPHLVTSYGASEFSPIATAPHHQISGTAGAVGYVCAGATVQAADDSGRPLAPGETGLIRVRGDFLVGDYVGNPAGSDQAFRNGWFYPGDIGAVTADNVLVISGRQTAVLNVGGNKMGPEAIEQAALAFPGVAQAGAFGVENEFGILEVWTAVVAPRGLDEAGLHRHLQKRLPDQFVPRRILRLDGLPKNTAGKLDRRRLTDMARGGKS